MLEKFRFLIEAGENANADDIKRFTEIWISSGSN